VISESFVSRRHCEIKYITVDPNDNNSGNPNQIDPITGLPTQHPSSKFFLRDIGSTTGAFIMVRQEINLRENMMF
jgi:pSer/pThr/pTyr-binding forkhead associated (FHA) protein